MDQISLSPDIYLSRLEREADEARFDWLEHRSAPNASELFAVFKARAWALANALSSYRSYQPSE